MPVEMEAGARRAVARVVAAPVVELSFSCYVVEKRAESLGNVTQPWLKALSTEQPDLLQRIAGFWNDEAYYEWAELVILAQRAGALFGEPEELFAALGKTAAKRYSVPELASEAEGVREIVQSRLDRLAASAELRDAYEAVLRELWAFLKPYWDGGAAATAREMAASYGQRLERVPDLRQVLPATHFARRVTHAPLVERAIEAGEAVIVPLALGGVGVAFLSLPGALIIGVGPDAEKRLDRRRESAERSAARFKVLSDPTRLAILASFCHQPISISELTEYFDLSQPTISVHVKMLRESGLLEATKVRGQTLYRSSRERVSELVEAALSDTFGG